MKFNFLGYNLNSLSVVNYRDKISMKFKVFLFYLFYLFFTAAFMYRYMFTQLKEKNNEKTLTSFLNTWSKEKCYRHNFESERQIYY